LFNPSVIKKLPFIFYSKTPTYFSFSYSLSLVFLSFFLGVVFGQNVIAGAGIGEELAVGDSLEAAWRDSTG
jgi:hypothetical protein